MNNLRKSVFLPSFLLLLASAIASILIPESFLNATKSINNWILQHFDWLFSWGTFSFLVLLAISYFSPLAKIRIGGKNAKPILNRWQWFSITLCTTIATGILFWGVAEPVFHLHSSPEAIENKSVFSMSTLFMHWTVTPYGIYTIAGLVFALCFYNLKQPFTVSTLLYPLLKEKSYGLAGKITDSICLFALVAGMAASLGAGILSISGGLSKFLSIESGSLLYGLVGLFIVLAFVISASTGLQRGIKLLSSLNIRLFFALGIFVFLAGPTWEILQIGGSGFLDFIKNFFSRSLSLDSDLDDGWIQSWTVFYWANWLAWTPVTALFLGRISLGYTVRDFIHFNLLLPSLFGGVWMLIFSGTTIIIDNQNDGTLNQALTENGPESIMYQILEYLPFTGIMTVIILIIIFISYVTAADSNTSAMSAMSVKGISQDNQEAPWVLKAIWGILIGTISWIMISFAGIDGIKMISNLGGFPALFLLILVGVGLIKLMLNWRDLE
ncbi:MAG: choline-glycine betaine transporter [Flammeovirgaceae bacterium]|jgi:glycine betaine transporter